MKASRGPTARRVVSERGVVPDSPCSKESARTTLRGRIETNQRVYGLTLVLLSLTLAVAHILTGVFVYFLTYGSQLRSGVCSRRAAHHDNLWPTRCKNQLPRDTYLVERLACVGIHAVVLLDRPLSAPEPAMIVTMDERANRCSQRQRGFGYRTWGSTVIVHAGFFFFFFEWSE